MVPSELTGEGRWGGLLSIIFRVLVVGALYRPWPTRRYVLCDHHLALPLFLRMNSQHKGHALVWPSLQSSQLTWSWFSTIDDWIFDHPLWIHSFHYEVRAKHHGFLLPTNKIRVGPGAPWCWEAVFQWPSFPTPGAEAYNNQPTWLVSLKLENSIIISYN